MLNEADIVLPDGISLFWAARFLSMPLTAYSAERRAIQVWAQALHSLARILIKPAFVRSALPERICGSDLVWDLAELAAEREWSVYLLGGFGDTTARAAQVLSSRFQMLKIVGCSNKNPDDPAICEDINRVAPDMLFVAYGPVRQELWIRTNLPHLSARLAIGLGGTFDYLCGNVATPPRFVRQSGLEWLFRLVTQPRRYHRILDATVGLLRALVIYKLLVNLPQPQARGGVTSEIVKRQPAPTSV